MRCWTVQIGGGKQIVAEKLEPGISGIFKSGEILEVVVKPEQLRGFHNDPETKQSYIMAAVGREAADFDMSHEDAKQLCRAMIDLFGGTVQTQSHLETAFFHGYKKHLGYDAVLE